MPVRSPEVRVEHGVDDGIEGGAGQGEPLDDRHHSLTRRGARGDECVGHEHLWAHVQILALTRQM